MTWQPKIPWFKLHTFFVNLCGAVHTFGGRKLERPWIQSPSFKSCQKANESMEKVPRNGGPSSTKRMSRLFSFMLIGSNLKACCRESECLVTRNTWRIPWARRKLGLLFQKVLLGTACWWVGGMIPVFQPWLQAGLGLIGIVLYTQNYVLNQWTITA